LISGLRRREVYVFCVAFWRASGICDFCACISATILPTQAVGSCREEDDSAR